MFIYLTLASAIAAGITLFTSTTGFWISCAVGIFSASFTWYSVLRKMPVVSFDGLSSEAEGLLSKYNHAWAAPNLTRRTSFEIGVWQIVCVGSGLVFVFHQSWWSLLAIFGVCSFFSYMVGGINPQMYIRKMGLGDANDEIAAAYMAKENKRHPELVALLDAAKAKAGERK